jgi:hypothetical protein
MQPRKIKCTIQQESFSLEQKGNKSPDTTSKNPTEGKTTAVIAVMRGKPKDGYHHHHNNKHLVDRGSDGGLVFVSKDKSMLFPYLKRLVPKLWNSSNGIFQTKHTARVELNFFDYSDSKR